MGVNLTNKIIEASQLKKDYFIGKNRLRVLKGIDLSIAPGEIVAVVGASGAGKSTLLHILGTLDKPTSGVVLHDGIDVFRLPDNRLAEFRSRQIGFVFQFHHLLPEFSALENVSMPAMIAGKRLSEAKPMAARLLAEVGLADRLEHRPSELSGGEQQRIAVARALINDPKVVLADEPSGNLDSVTAEGLHGLIAEMCKKRQTTFVIATHNDHLSSLAHRILRIQDGIISN
jgi:lipoprotein-releasing system ATP-binding protein